MISLIKFLKPENNRLSNLLNQPESLSNPEVSRVRTRPTSLRLNFRPELLDIPNSFKQVARRASWKIVILCFVFRPIHPRI